MRARELIDDPVLEDELPQAVLILAAQLCKVREAKPNGSVPADQLLDLDEAARRLNVSSSWLYRRSSKLPFVVRNGRKLSFSERGIEQYIASKKGANFS
jgi:predicted DNA-binding transcriptional regulator AlpA